MINLVPGSDAKIKKLVFENSVRSYYYSACERYTNGYVNTFITDMQILITKLGIMVSEVSISKRKISYCYDSINFLCREVLDNPSLINTFNSIGLNDKGNDGKHTIARNVTIDMDKCVNAYNNLVNSIINKYKLHSLKDMIVRKNIQKSSNQTNTYTSYSDYYKIISSPKINTYQTTPKKTTVASTHKNNPDATAASKDENLKVKVSLEKGQGVYTKGLFNKKSMLNFKLILNIENQSGLKIKKATAVIKGKNDGTTKSLPTSLYSITEFDVPMNLYSGHIEAVVVIEYKIGIFSSKTIKVKVSKNF
jgi:hypothetical protein